MTETIDLTYRLSARWNKALRDRCDDASVAELLYEMFLGDLSFRIGDADFSALWGWVPIMDVVRQLMRAVRQLPAINRLDIDFTESDALLRLDYEDGVVTISSTYSPAVVKVTLSDFDDAVRRFATDAIQDFEAKCPGLRGNPLIQDMIPKT
jgi:hypothetical protein